MPIVHTATAAHRQGLVVTGARSGPHAGGFCASCAVSATHSQRVRHPLASSSFSIVLQPRSSSRPPASGSERELAWQVAPAAPRPYVLRVVAAAPSLKSAGTSRY
ncbi:hypothetical protein CTheo_8515 [Ceratobasidium theobromae]|uniref:Uncharacterized protein n=1 Tax=Ceratobasidium theobromae TaxID=1582974 RepID=A0A5N5Q9D7_9AGAM|nr:hypothetical protein CTheo_8515 [Ceratobasidium theobromae]